MKNRIKVVMYIPTLLGGGAERVFVNLANHFSQNGIEIIFITSFNEGYINQLNRDVTIKYILHKKKYTTKLFNKTHRIALSIIKITYYLRLYRPDYLITSLDEANIIGYVSNLLSTNKGKHIVRQANIVDADKKNAFVKFMLHRSFKKSYKIIANSPDTKDSIDKFTNHLSNNIIIIGNPVYNSDQMQMNKYNSYMPLDSDYILSVGRLDKIKDQKTLIKAYKIVKEKYDISLIILGDGPMKQDLLSLVDDLNLRRYVLFPGFVDNPYSYYKNAKLFVLSSLSEGFGNVLIEALSFGKTIISTDCLGGPNYILENGKYGILTPVKDHIAMADSILSVLDGKSRFNPDMLIERAKDFSISYIGDRYIEIF